MLVVVVLALLGADPAPAPAPSPPPSTTPAPTAPASLVDRVVAKSLVDDGKAAEAKAVLPTIKVVVDKKGEQKAADSSDDLKKGEELLAKKDGKGALVAFRRALAKAPKSVPPLWGISRAADMTGDKATAKRFAQLYVRSAATDKDKDVLAACQWRVEQPDDDVPPPTTAVRPASVLGTTPTGALPPTAPGAPGAPSSSTPSTTPAPTPY